MRAEETTMTQKLLGVVLAIGMLGVCALAQKTSTVQGVVVTIGPDGDRSVVAGAKISLDGPAYITAESNEEGKFVINGVPQGSYEITARSPGMTAERNIEIFPGTVSEVMLWMKLETVNESVTVNGKANEIATVYRVEVR